MYRPPPFYVLEKLDHEENTCLEVERGDRLIDVSSRHRVF